MAIKTREFLKALFDPYLSEHKQLLEIRQINSGRDIRSGFYSDIDSAREALINREFKGNVYFGVTPRFERSGKKSSINTITSIWADIDFGSIGHKKTSPYKTLEETLAAIGKFPLHPSIIVYSGHGVHTYWLLKEPYQFDSPELIEEILKNIGIELQADPGTQNVNRVLRVPNTVNWKIKSAPIKSKILEFNPQFKYTFEEFYGLSNMISLD